MFFLSFLYIWQIWGKVLMLQGAAKNKDNSWPRFAGPEDKTETICAVSSKQISRSVWHMKYSAFQMDRFQSSAMKWNFWGKCKFQISQTLKCGKRRETSYLKCTVGNAIICEISPLQLLNIMSNKSMYSILRTYSFTEASSLQYLD